MADINDPQLRQPDHTPSDSEQGGSSQVPAHASTGVSSAQADQALSSQAAFDEYTQNLRRELFAKHVNRLRTTSSTSTFAQDPKYLRAASDQLHRGSEPFRVLPHHFWQLRRPRKHHL